MRTRTPLLTSTAGVICTAFNNTGWKMDGDKLAVDSSGNPIYVDSSGNEKSVDGTTISRLNGEARQHREAKEAAETKLKEFDGIDPKAARDALDKISKIDQKQLIDAGKVDEVRAEITKQFESQLSERDKALSERDSKIKKMTIDTAFATSEFYGKNIAVPRDMFEATFGKYFDADENGKIIAKGPDGNQLYSKARYGEPATFDEALEMLVEGYSQKDAILKAPEHRGSGNKGGGGNLGGGRIVKRADFEKMHPSQQAEASQAMAKGELKIVD